MVLFTAAGFCVAYVLGEVFEFPVVFVLYFPELFGCGACGLFR